MGSRYTGLRGLVALWTAPCFVAFMQLAIGSGGARNAASLIACAAVSAGGFFATRWAIPTVARSTERRGLFGYDINKKGTPAGEKKVPNFPPPRALYTVAPRSHPHPEASPSGCSSLAAVNSLRQF